MGANQFGGDREAEAGAAGLGGALERLEQALAQVIGNAGAVVGDARRDDRAFAPGLQRDGALLS